MKNHIIFSSFILILLSKPLLAGFKTLHCTIEENPAVFTALLFAKSAGFKAAHCFDDGSETEYKVAFSGIGVGLEYVKTENLTLVYSGFSSDVVGSYYGARASVLVVNGVLAFGNWGNLLVYGTDLGLGIGATGVRFVIGREWKEVEQEIQQMPEPEAEKVTPEEAAPQKVEPKILDDYKEPENSEEEYSPENHTDDYKE